MRRHRMVPSVRVAAGAILVSLIIFLVGCNPIVHPLDALPNEATPIQLEEATMPVTAADVTAAEPTAVDLAKADLATQLSVAMDMIEVVDARDVAWRDSSLGCPEPDMMYAQMMVGGMKIILAVDGQEYHYHSGHNRDPFLCEKPVQNGSMEG